LKRLLVLAVASFVAAATSVSYALPAAAASPTCNDSFKYDTNIPWPDWPGHFVGAQLPGYFVEGLVSTSRCTLRRGNVGESVAVLQNTLNECFNLSEVLEEDGVFGGRTEAMLKQAQSYVGTAVDGVYGPNTRNAISSNYDWAAYDPYSGRLYCQSVKGLE
jgi:peptidoglycan hydrolase-like protein with peptidoglycan-binding domain